MSIAPLTGAEPAAITAAAVPRRPRLPRQAAMERGAARALRFLETGFAGLALFLFSQALVILVLEGDQASAADPNEGNTVLRTMFSSIHAVSLLLVAIHRREALRALSSRVSLALLVALALASTLWSAAPDLTLRRSLALLGTTAFGIFLAVRFDTRSLLGLVAGSLGVAALLSAVFALAIPSLGVATGGHAGAWQGVFPHKNMLGQVMVVGAMAWALLRPLLPVRQRWLGTVGMLACAGLVVLSASKTALTVLLALAACVAVYRVMRWKTTLAVPVVVGCVLAAGVTAVVVVGNLEPILVAMGKDPTLTGRTPIWRALLGSIGERPWVGYGYNGYWLGEQGPAARTLAAIGWHTPSAHNGFLDLALQLGVVGTAIFLLGFGGAFRRAFVVLRRTRTAEGLWPVAFLTFTLLYNVTESVLVERNNLYWVLYVAVACSPLLRAAGPLPRFSPLRPATSSSPGDGAPPARHGVVRVRQSGAGWTR